MNYILKDENAIYYECGFSSDNALFLSINNDKYFITDSRYTLEAKQSINNAQVVDGSHNLVKKAREIIRKYRIKRLIIDPKEWDIISFEQLKTLNIYLSYKKDFSQKKRIIKTNKEIEIIKEAVKKTKIAFDQFYEYIKSDGIGKDEKELNFVIQNILKNNGQYDLSFEPIVAINENSALPHALSSNKVLQKDDLILVDAGLKYKRYCSDRTRTYINKNSKKQQKIKDIVQKAHDKAIESIRVGIKAKEIDKIARDVIQKAGYGKYFIHSTGHGVGLDIHELPIISKTSDTIIEENMVFTIEPGIYIEKEFGVRIEDMVVVQNGRAKVL